MAIIKSIGNVGESFIIKYSMSDGCTSSTVSCVKDDVDWFTVNDTYGPGQVKVIVAENTSTTARSADITFKVDGNECANKKVTISQAAAVACDCDTALTLGSDSIILESDSTSGSVWYYSGDCMTDFNVIMPNDLDDGLRLDIDDENGDIVIITTRNNTGDTKNTTVYVSYGVNGSPCTTKEIQVTWKGSGTGGTSCSCDSILITNGSVEWASKEKNYKDVTLEFSGSCSASDIELMLDDGSHFSAVMFGDAVRITPKGFNSSDKDYTDIIRVKLKSNSAQCGTILIKQSKEEPVQCNCEFSPTYLSWECSETGSKGIDFTCSTISRVSIEDSESHFEVGFDGNDIVVTPVGKNTSDHDIDAKVLVECSDSCKYSGITIVHSSGSTCQTATATCDCSNVVFADVSSGFTYYADEYNSKIETRVTVKGECAASDWSVSCDNNHFSAYTFANGDGVRIFGAAVTAANTGTTDITGEATLSFKLGTEPCQKKMSLIHKKKVVTYSCDDVTFDKNSLSYGYNEIDWKSIIIYKNGTGASDFALNLPQNTRFSGVTVPITADTFMYEIRPTSENTGTDAVTETATITYNVGGNSCSKQITLTQSAKACDCDTALTVTPVHVCMANYSNAPSNEIIATYSVSDSCVTVTGATTDANWISDIEVSNGEITGWLTSAYGLRTANLTVYGKKSDGTTCSKTVQVTASLYEIETNGNGSSSGGQIQFNLKS